MKENNLNNVYKRVVENLIRCSLSSQGLDKIVKLLSNFNKCFLIFVRQVISPDFSRIQKEDSFTDEIRK